MKKLCIISALLYTTMSHSQVNLQTGAAELNFPLFQHSDPKSRLGTDISLSYYDGDGLKVNEVASSVGTGWALQMGGVISRIQNGEPDDQMYVKINTGDQETYYEKTAMGYELDYYFPNGYMYTAVSPLDPVPGSASFNPVFPGNVPSNSRLYKPNFEDREQDIYSFQFNGTTGQFIIGKNKTVQIINNSKIKISFTEADMTSSKIRTRIASFTIIDESGIKYVFSEKEVLDVMKYKEVEIRNGYSILKPFDLDFTNALSKIVSRWFLTEIINTATNDKIIFNYENVILDYEGIKHASKQTVFVPNENIVSKQVAVERIKGLSKRLVSILCPDGYSATFLYSIGERADLPGTNVLTGINIFFSDRLLYGYTFNYGYMFKKEIKPFSTSFLPQEKRYARLCLTSFRKVGTGGKMIPPYIFEYFIPDPQGYALDIVPPVFSFYADHWGYYNNFPTFITEDSEGYPVGDFGQKSFGDYSQSSLAKNGIIKKVTFPEGGTLEFEFELNQDEASIYTNKYSGGVRVSKTVLYDGVSHSQDVIKQFKYINENGTSSGWGFDMPNYLESRIIRQYVISGNNPQRGQYAKEFGGIMALAIGGVRESSFQKVFTTRFGASKFTGAEASASAFAAMVVFMLSQIYNIIFTDPYRDYNASIINTDNVKLRSPLPKMYKRVEVIDVTHNSGIIIGSEGKVIHEFSSDSDYPFINGNFTQPYSAKPRYVPWVYGLIKKIIWLNNQGLPVKKIENNYSAPIVIEINDNNNFLSKAYSVNTVLSASYQAFNQIFQNNFITSETYFPFQGRIELLKTIETIYNSTGSNTTTETTFTYNSNNYLPRTVTTKKSNGDLTGTTTYFTIDYNIPGSVINTMKGNNMVNEPVTVISWIKGPLATARKMTGSVVTDYIQIDNTDIRPSKILQTEINEPVDNTIADEGNFDPAKYKEYTYLKEKVITTYSQGNPVQTTSIQGNASVSKMYDYNNRLAIAEVSNAISGEIKYTSFEAEGNGGWSFTPANIIEDFSPTGKKCIDLSKGAIGSNLLPAINNPVIVSMWSTAQPQLANVVGAVFSSARVGPTINGWTYYEFESTGNISQSAQFNITGSGKLDELRFYPKNARMTTVTYEPGIGKTSECDANNRVIYYEYDEFGRLLQIRDQYRNLLKAFEYNYKQ